MLLCFIMPSDLLIRIAGEFDCFLALPEEILSFLRRLRVIGLTVYRNFGCFCDVKFWTGFQADSRWWK